jgi:parallel beta-helix repeat protein
MELKSIISLFTILLLFAAFSGCVLDSSNLSIKKSASEAEGNYSEISGPIVIKSPGNYRLVQNLTPPEPTQIQGTSMSMAAAINIKSAGVVIDGMGYTVECRGKGKNDYYDQSTGIQTNFNANKLGSGIIIKNVSITNCFSGLALNRIANSRVENVTLVGNVNGVLSVSSSNITFNHNIFRDNYWGIEGHDVENFFMDSNTFSRNQKSGIFLSGEKGQPPVINIAGYKFYLFSYSYFDRTTSGNGHIISNNEILENGEGISLERSNGNQITENSILNSRTFGIDLRHVDQSIITGNVIANSGQTGINLQNCGWGNFIRNNNLSGNSQNIEQTNYPESVPLSVIIGIFLVYLIKILTGASKVVSKVGSSRVLKQFSMIFGNIEGKISGTVNKYRISAFLEKNLFVSLIGAVILGGAFTYITSVGLKIEILATWTMIGAIVVIVPKAIQYILAGKNEMLAEYRLWWGGILVILLTTVVFRNVFGQPVRTAIKREDECDKKKLAVVMLTGPIVSILLSSAFLLLYLMGGTYASLGMMGLEMSLLAAVVTFIPISPMDGERVYLWNKIVWAIIFFPVLFVYSYFILFVL